MLVTVTLAGALLGSLRAGANATLGWMLFGVCSAVVANVVLMLDAGPYVPGSLGESFLLLSYLAVGAAALTTSGAVGAAPRAEGERLGGARLGVLGLLLVVPAVTAAAVPGGSGLPARVVLVAVSTSVLAALVMVRIQGLVVARERAEAALAHRATHDALTGLPNRTAFEERLARALPRAEPGRAVVVGFCDLDGFKGVNDRLGHAAGDEVLQVVARRLARAVRPGDVVCRRGGDEFLVLCLGVDESSVDELAARLTEASRTTAPDGAEVTGSLGLVMTTDRDADPVALLHEADARMYAAKAVPLPRPRREARPGPGPQPCGSSV